MAALGQLNLLSPRMRMRPIIIGLLCFLALRDSLSTAHAGDVIWTPKSESQSIHGSWQFAALRYKGQEMLPPNPDLILLYEFTEDGFNRLYWHRLGESGFCERRGLFAASEGFFLDYVIWVNRANRGDCAQDPDMKLGRMSKNVYRVKEGRLEMDLQLSDEILTYIWKPLHRRP